jgi:tripartite-type tricarboxylate transporter receptor subunit TctC
LSFLLMGRPYVAPPGVPADRVKLLRDSFMKTLASPEFLQEAKRANLDISPMTGEEIHALLDRQYKTSPDLVQKVRGMMIATGK